MDIVVEIGKQVKKHSGKPFKSGEVIGTVESYCTNLSDPKKRIAYVIKEDQSIVSAWVCYQY
jgi:hypothetical protein